MLKALYTTLMSFLLICPVSAQTDIIIDAQKDVFYETLSGPDNGFLILTPEDYLPYCGPKPESKADLSGRVWMAWDDEYWYVYAEITDDVVNTNNTVRTRNDCIELKFDPDPSAKSLTGVVNARLTALDSTDVLPEHFEGIDNLYSEKYLDSTASASINYARRLTDTGYALEMRLKWIWMQAEGKTFNVKTGSMFGLGVNIHDNDSDQRDGSIQWSTGMADEIWITPQLLGTAELIDHHKIKLHKKNVFIPEARPGVTFISKQRSEKWGDESIVIENWLYRPGDYADGANPMADDSDWERFYPVLMQERMPQSGWPNIGWFRVHLIVDSSLVGVPLGLNFSNAGAAELFLNGESLYRFGVAAEVAEQESIKWERKPRYIVFRNHARHVLAVKYSNTYTDFLANIGIHAGFHCYLNMNYIDYVDDRFDVFRTFTLYETIFSVIPMLLGIFHLFLYLFYPTARENLYFSLATICWAIVVFTSFHEIFFTDIEQIFFYTRLNILSLMPAIIFGLLTLYQTIYHRILKQIWLFVGIGIVVTIWSLIRFYDEIMAIVIYATIGLATLEIFRIIFFAGFKRWQGRWLMLIGFAIFMVTVLYQIFYQPLDLPRVGQYGIIFVYGLLVLSIFVSIDLSIKFANTSRNLEKRLIEVQNLSKSALENERRIRNEELTRKLLEADNERKTHELEEARKLQLSMLPTDFRTPSYLELEAKMVTANEVGGDYYDFHLSADNTFTVAIGDATGHGMRAGTMVASIKSLFAAFGNQLSINEFFNRCTEIIKEMHMGNLFMGLMLVRINGKTLTAAAAGMPPIFIYKKRSDEITEMVLKGMPLGAHKDFNYPEKSTTISSGDVILLLTDGLPELFNAKKEMFDYGRIKDTLIHSASESPSNIIKRLINAGEKWRGEQPRRDDATFVVIRIK